MKYLSVYVVAAAREEARKIARALVDEKLAACVNILGDVESIYRWNDVVEEARECAMIIKTTDDVFAALKARVVELHSYDCPCIVAWEIADGHAPYLDWIVANTRCA